MADSPPPAGAAADAVRWWRAYALAEHDQADALRELVAAGDDHARRHLASWLSDRGFTAQGSPDRAALGEAIDVIGPLADAGDEIADLWLARWLADCDRLAELRERADRGSFHASRELARCLADHDMLDELRARAAAARGGYHDSHALRELARRLAQRDMHQEVRELAETADAARRQLILEAASEGHPGLNTRRALADLGHEQSRFYLARLLAREGRLDELRQRAKRGDEYARHFLDEAPHNRNCQSSA